MGATVLCFVEIFDSKSVENTEAICLAEFHIPRNRDLLAALGWQTPKDQKPFQEPRGVPPGPSFEFTREYEDEDFVTWLTPEEMASLYLHWKTNQPEDQPKFLQLEILVYMLLAADLPEPYQMRVVWCIC